MSTIKTKLVDQNITVTNAPNIYSGDVNTDNVVFEFDASWEGFTKSAVFYRNPKERYLQLLKDDQCVIPHEVMGDEGKVVIGVFGVNDDKVITSEVLYYDIGKGAVVSDEMPEPTPDIWAQILADYHLILLKTAEFTNQITSDFKQFKTEVNKILEDRAEVIHVMDEQSYIEVQDRIKGHLYFNTTKRESGVTDGTIAVSPNMRLKVIEH